MIAKQIVRAALPMLFDVAVVKPTDRAHPRSRFEVGAVRSS